MLGAFLEGGGSALGLGLREAGSSEVTRSGTVGQGRLVSSGRGAEARAAGTEGEGPRSPCQQEAWPGPDRCSHAPAPRPGGEVNMRTLADRKG